MKFIEHGVGIQRWYNSWKNASEIVEAQGASDRIKLMDKQLLSSRFDVRYRGARHADDSGDFGLRESQRRAPRRYASAELSIKNVAVHPAA